MNSSNHENQPLALSVIHPKNAQQLPKAVEMIHSLNDIKIKPNNFVANLNPTKNKEFFKDVLIFVEKCCLRKTFTLKPSFQYESYLKEFWYTATVTALNTIKFTVENGTTNLEFDLFSFRKAIGADYLKRHQQYEANPDGKVTKLFFGQIGYSDKLTGTLRKRGLAPNWKLLMTLIIQCIGGNTGGYDQINSMHEIVMYGLANGVSIDFGKIIYEDLVKKLKKKIRGDVMNYTRFISLVMEFQMGPSYHTSNSSIIETPTFSDDYFSISQQETVGAPLTQHMMSVCNSEISTNHTGTPASSESEDVQNEVSIVPVGKKGRRKSRVKKRYPSSQNKQNSIQNIMEKAQVSLRSYHSEFE